MDIVCICCKNLIRTVESHSSRVSHGVCRNCLPKLVKELGQPLSEFLDELGAPILVLQEETRIVAANAAARKMSSEPLEELCGRLCGDVIGCLHSKEPGGCGQTVHCLSCTIRRSVAHTMETGKSCKDVPAYPDIGMMDGDRKVRFLISKEKKGYFVQLRIDWIEETPSHLYPQD